MSTVYVIRHADAGETWEWPKNDEERPLTNYGKEQARELVNVFKPYGVAHIYSSLATRCEQTVSYLHRALKMPIETSALLGVGRGHVIAPFIRSLPQETAIICTHADNITALIQQVHSDDHLAIPKRLLVPSGSYWVLTRAGTVFTSITYVPPGQTPPAPAAVDSEDDEVWIE